MSSSSRSFPLPALLAALGGLAALGSLMLPWFAVNTAALADVVSGMGLDKLTLPGVPQADLSANVNAGIEQMRAQMSADLVGYKVFNPISLVPQVLGALAGIWVALRIFGGDEAPEHSSALIFGAIAIAGRPIYALVEMPSAGDQERLGLATPLMTAETGIYVALAGAGLLVLAVVAAAFRGSATKSDVWIPQAGAVPGGAHVPMGLTGGGAAPQAYTTPSAPSHYPGPPTAAGAGPFVPAAPMGYQPSGGYGDEGPSTLDRDSRLVRPNDPHAPKPLAAPAVPIMPAPVEVAPLHDPSPVHDAPGAIYGVPRPQAAPQATPETRSGSTAPPGFA